ncbi:MAG: polysaccharide pyruvyl transferase family protein [Lachnospiraceae bacterium]|jgi:hypothetical protein|nr:polysaccharide pyruvyl transferase family protein [Lachnospiraceae bacterium]MCI1656820.1 polysaccharide pyruvyl transferase family protein [Lachnospiraceae bacterium]MCI2195174.1 polysaccharide pyruvyl transferase family protein [Lachnospiraceae bacterium]
MSNVGILTWHYYKNFGSLLQAYALQTIIEKFGHKSKFVNYRNLKFGKLSNTHTLIKIALSKSIGRIDSQLVDRFYYPTDEFLHQYLNQTSVVYDISKIESVCSNMEYIVYGSDQIWAPNVFDSVYLGDGVKSSFHSKVSYAPSIGMTSLPSSLIERYKVLLMDFSDVSVREEEGKTILEKDCAISSKVVLDPTFLLEVSYYMKLEIEPKCKPLGKYIFCYFLKNDNNYFPVVKKYAEEHGLLIYGVATDDCSEWMKQYKNIGPREFLWLINRSEMVMTDSYHGTIFSLLYHKHLAVFERFEKDDPINQNSRIFQLDRWFGIKNRIVDKKGDIDHMPELDYQQFENNLQEARKKSLFFLKEALR